MSKKYNNGTICVQGGYSPKNGDPRVLPLYQSTTYKYDDPDFLADLFDLKAEGHIYSRISNPTVAAFEEKINGLEGGVGALATSSGQSASMIAILNICKSGDHILCSSTIYGGVFNLFTARFKDFGIDVTFFNPDLSADDIIKLGQENTKVVYGETIGNPGLNILNFEKISSVAKSLDVPFIVDNTLATPYLCNPLKYGANIVVHSTTKYIDGHASCVGGIIVDGGNFDWDNGKFDGLVKSDPTYHGIEYTKVFGNAAYIFKSRVQLMRDYGSTMSPFNAYLTNFGVETLHLRMERHSYNALKLAEYLEKHENISWVNYPGLENSKSYELANKYLPKGTSGVLTFGVKGGLENAKTFIRNLKLATLVTHVGDSRTCVLHPASTTHRQLTSEQQLAAGVAPDLIRLSIGIEDIYDIIFDVEQALTF